ncbi:MAG: carboxypeptidase regulatory-like domain-containing protein [Bdellovibrionales bacterium]|nr:carboxypeptidase regulatory-like domain-containing protein [Bdellovibrionales bacterium]
MRLISKITLSLLLLAATVPLHSAFAQEADLLVKDTGGFTRASSSVEGSGSVEFTLVDAAGSPAEGVEVTLTNSLSGETLTAISSNGTVVFEGVAPGTWTVASTASGVTFTNVAITSTALAAGAGLGASSALIAASSITVVGAGSAIAASESDDGNPLSPAS